MIFKLTLFLLFFVIFTTLVGVLLLLNTKKSQRNKQVGYLITVLVLGFLIIFGYIVFEIQLKRIMEYANKSDFVRDVMISIRRLFHFTEASETKVKLLFITISNIILFSLFIVIKGVNKLKIAIFNIASRNEKRKNKEENRNILDEDKEVKSNFAYDVVRGEGYVKKEYVFVSIVFKVFSFYSFLMIIFLVLSVAFIPDKVNIIISYIFKQPELPVIALVIFLEIFWYFDGNLEGYKDKNIAEQKKEKSSSVQILDWTGMFEKYREIWSKNLLISERRELGLEVENNTIEENEKLTDLDEKEMKIFYDNIIKKGNNENKTYFQILKTLWNKENVLISDVNYNEINPFLISYLDNIINNGEKVIILIEEKIYYNEKKRNEIVKWLEDWFKALFEKNFKDNIKTCEQIQGDTKLTSILLATQNILISSQHIIKALTNNESENITIVEFIEDSTEIAENIISLSVLSKILDSYFKKTQHIIITNYSEGLQSAIHNSLGILTKEYRIKKTCPKISYVMAWKQEAGDTKERFQDMVFKGYISVYLGVETILSLIPIINKTRVNIIDHTNIPTDINIKELQKNLEQIDKSLINVNSIGQPLVEVINNIKIPFMIDKDRNKFVIAYDKNNNLIEAVKKYLNLGSENTFVHVISPSYLLRGYLVDNYDYFNITPIYSLMPKISDNKFKVALFLIDLLIVKEMEEKDIQKELNKVIENVRNTEDELIKLFYETYGIDLLKNNLIKVKRVNELNKDRMTFEEKKIFSLSNKVKEDKYFDWMKEFTLNDSKNLVYGKISLDHLYQNYLPEQIHSIDGISYKVESIDRKTSIINITQKDLNNICNYRNKDSIRIKNVNNKYYPKIPAIENGNFIIEKNIYEADFDVQTHGYYEFNGKIDLSSHGYKYKDLEKLNEKFIRKYDNGRILSVMIGKKNAQIKNFERVAFTLTILINEVMPTLFPGNFRYIKIFTLLSQDFFNDEMLVGSEKNYEFITANEYSHIFPYKISVNKDGIINENRIKIKENTKDKIFLYFVEDSHKDTGIIKPLEENFDYILHLVQDYLEWLEEGVDEIEKDEFLKYGQNSYSSEFAIKDLKKLLNEMYPENHISTKRKKYYGIPKTIILEEKEEIKKNIKQEEN